jgi:hypothetical protein
MSAANQSKKQLAFLLGGFLVVVVGAILALKAYNSLDEKDTLIGSLEREVTDLEGRRMLQLSARSKYEQWRQISLPPDEAVAKSRYKLFLQELARKHQMFIKGSITDSGHGSVVSQRGANSAVNPLSFNMSAEATLPKLIGFLHDFYSINLPHTIRKMSIAKAAGDNDGRLDVAFNIEALSLANATNRDFLTALPGAPLLAIDVFTAMKGGPSAFALAPWLATPTGAHGARKLAERIKKEREYTHMVAKNVFLGLQPPASIADGPGRTDADKEILRFVQLTGITSNIFATEAILFNRRTGKFITLRAEGGFDSFEIHDLNNSLVLKGTVKAVTDKDLVILVEGKHYGVHVGGFLDKSLEKALTAGELKDLGVTAETATEAAATEKEKPGEP